MNGPHRPRRVSLADEGIIDCWLGDVLLLRREGQRGRVAMLHGVLPLYVAHQFGTGLS